MVKVPEHITITVDEEALRQQIRAVILEEIKVASARLRLAAEALDPDFMNDHNKYLYEQWEKAQMRDKEDPTNG